MSNESKTFVHRYDFFTQQKRDSYASYIGHRGLLTYMSLAYNVTPQELHHDFIMKMYQPCGPPPPGISSDDSEEEESEEESEEEESEEEDSHGQEAQAESEFASSSLHSQMEHPLAPPLKRSK